MHSDEGRKEAKDNGLLAKALHLRKMLDWAPLIVSSALGGDYLHLALIIATAITAFNIFLDAVFRKFGVIKVWPKYLDVCFFVTFGVTLILAYTIPGSFVRRWLQVIIMGGITALIALGLCVGHPFTSDIAKETVAEEFWEQPHFKRTNIIITSIWIGIFIVMTISYVIVAALNANGNHDNGIFIAFNYVVPLGFLFAGIVFSKWYPHHLRQKRLQQMASEAECAEAPKSPTSGNLAFQSRLYNSSKV